MTLIGVKHNPTTQEMKFLLLDPHYSGPEDVKKIIKEGWLSWKSPSFFVKDSFYNFCLPQLPPTYPRK